MADENEKIKQVNIRFGKGERDRRLSEWMSADQAALGTDFNVNDLVKTLLYDWYVARHRTSGPPLPIWKTNGTGPVLPAGAGASALDEEYADPDDELSQRMMADYDF